jgi:hypothetical protein
VCSMQPLSSGCLMRYHNRCNQGFANKVLSACSSSFKGLLPWYPEVTTMPDLAWAAVCTVWASRTRLGCMTTVSLLEG